MVVGTRTGKAGESGVFLSEGLKPLSYLQFTLCLGQVVVALELYALRHFGIKTIQRRNAGFCQHLFQVFFRMGEKLVCHYLKN